MALFFNPICRVSTFWRLPVCCIELGCVCGGCFFLKILLEVRSCGVQSVHGESRFFTGCLESLRDAQREPVLKFVILFFFNKSNFITLVVAGKCALWVSNSGLWPKTWSPRYISHLYTLSIIIYILVKPFFLISLFLIFKFFKLEQLSLFWFLDTIYLNFLYKEIYSFCSYTVYVFIAALFWYVS